LTVKDTYDFFGEVRDLRCRLSVDESRYDVGGVDG